MLIEGKLNMMTRHTLLICDDDPLFHIQVKQCIHDQYNDQYNCQTAYNGDEALAIIRKSPVDIILLDIKMRNSEEGLHIIPKLLELDPDLSIIIISGRSDFQSVRTAMQKGAVDYIPKDSDSSDLLHSIDRVARSRALLRRQEQHRHETLRSHHQLQLIGESVAILHLLKVLDKAKNSQSNVIITGETGSGKELIARQFRQSSKDGTLLPFVALDSATIQSTMAESILFGHEKGAFTGAYTLRKGAFEEADGGMIYFDEIANMPLEIQAKLMRVLQEKEITRLGSSRTIPLDFRVICATNQDLHLLAEEGKFKYDFLQRLNVIPIRVPPLRERPTDIPLLIQHFIEKHRFKKNPIQFSSESMHFLCSYHWPGNIRELSNFIAFMSTMHESLWIELADLSDYFRNTQVGLPTRSTHNQTQKRTFYEKVAEFEAAVLKSDYQDCKGNISRLARALQMDRSHLYSKLREYGIYP